jgi:hypothetical protein
VIEHLKQTGSDESRDLPVGPQSGGGLNSDSGRDRRSATDFKTITREPEGPSPDPIAAITDKAKKESKFQCTRPDTFPLANVHY